MKACSRCKKEYPVSQFGRHSQSPDGLNYWCKPCVSEKGKAQYIKSYPKIAARAAAWNKKNKVSLYAKKRDFRKAIMWQIFLLLGGKCQKCGNEDRRVLQIDHKSGGGSKHRKETHGSYSRYYGVIKTSIERGEDLYQLLCANCNWIAAIENGHRKSLWGEQYLETL